MAATAAMALSCNDRAALLVHDPMTEEQIAAGILTPEVMWKMNRVGGSVIHPSGQRVAMTVTRYKMDENRSYSSIWLCNADGTKMECLTKGDYHDSDPQWSDDGRNLFFLSDRGGESQLWKINVRARKPVQVSQIEGGIEAFQVSPDNLKVWYVKPVKVEKHKASDLYPDCPRAKALIYDDLMARHWDHWNEGEFRHIHLADLYHWGLRNHRDIMENEPWDAPLSPYFDAAEIAWNNASDQIAYTCKKLTGHQYAVSTDSDIYLYDLADQSTVNLTQGMPGYDKYPAFSPDDRKLAFTSMPRAGNESDKERLMVIFLESKAMLDLTRNFDYNATGLEWIGNEAIRFVAPIEATHQICEADLAGNVEVLTEGPHDVIRFSTVSGLTVAEVMSINRASELFTLREDGKLELLTDLNGHIYRNIRIGSVGKRMIPTTDGQEMLTWVITPPDFDPNKKYPALLYCQGGPQSVVSQFWSYRWNFQLMAAQGYVVVAPNRRGLPSFGQEWLDQISGDYSGQNIRDYLSAIDNVAAEPWVDETRLGCVGASYGGYSSFYLMGVHEKRFKAFISHCGMFNLEGQYASTEELWFPNNDLGGAPWSDSPTAQRSYENSPHKLVKNWDTPILIITGAQDFRIPYTQSLEAFTAARDRGLEARLVFFENEAHQVFKPQNSLVWNREFFGWLDKYLK